MGRRIAPDWDHDNLLKNGSAKWYWLFAPEEWMEDEILVHVNGRHSNFINSDTTALWLFDVLHSDLSPEDKVKALDLNFGTASLEGLSA